MKTGFPEVATVMVTVPATIPGKLATGTSCFFCVVDAARLTFFRSVPPIRTATAPQVGHWAATRASRFAWTPVRVSVAPLASELEYVPW